MGEPLSVRHGPSQSGKSLPAPVSQRRAPQSFLRYNIFLKYKHYRSGWRSTKAGINARTLSPDLRPLRWFPTGAMRAVLLYTAPNIIA